MKIEELEVGDVVAVQHYDGEESLAIIVGFTASDYRNRDKVSVREFHWNGSVYIETFDIEEYDISRLQSASELFVEINTKAKVIKAFIKNNATVKP